jgi:hypothetical protein
MTVLGRVSIRASWQMISGGRDSDATGVCQLEDRFRF